MPQENVAVVRRIYEAVARRDDVTPFEHYADDVVWDISGWHTAVLYRKSVYHGHEGIRENWRESVEAFGAIDFTVEELAEVGGKVVARVHEHHVGRASGAPAEATHWAVWTLAGGLVVRLDVVDTRNQALEVVGRRN